MITEFVEKFFFLLDNAGKMSDALFKFHHDFYANAWKKLTYDQQGEISYLILERIKMERLNERDLHRH